MALRQPPLYVKLYLWFLGIVLALAVGSFLLFLALGAGQSRPARINHGQRMVLHLSRALTAVPDGPALQDAVDGIHDDLAVDVAVLDESFNVRARAGQPFALPEPSQLEKARQKAIWAVPRGVVAGPVDGGVLLLRFPAVNRHRRNWRRYAQALMALALAAALLYPLSRSITRPLEQLTKAAEKFGRGDLSTRTGIDRQDEVGRLARTFDEMAARIQATRKAERELLANVSHELRTPLARLQIALELLDAKDEASRKRVASVREEVEELDRLIGDVLTTSRLELSALPLQKRPLALGELVDKARSRAQALDPTLQIDVDVAPEVQVEADEGLVSRVLDNLIDNARKYGAGAGPVRVEGRRDGGSALLAVQDRGPGLAADELDKIFEPFFRGASARASSNGGFGLGLALARRVAEAHGGSIRALNADGGGARFELRLPERA